MEWTEIEMAEVEAKGREAQKMVDNYRFFDRNDDHLRQAAGSLEEMFSLIAAIRQRHALLNE